MSLAMKLLLQRVVALSIRRQNENPSSMNLDALCLRLAVACKGNPVVVGNYECTCMSGRSREHVAISLGGNNFIPRLILTCLYIADEETKTFLGSARVHGNFLTLRRLSIAKKNSNVELRDL